MIALAPVLSVAETRALEGRAMAAFGLDERVLMQRAAAALQRHIRVHFPSAKRVGIAVGAGNNGGDGFWLATLLHADGLQVSVLSAVPTVPREGAAGEGQQRLHAMGVEVQRFAGELPVVDLWVDALFGIGLSRALQGEVAALVAAMNASGVPILAVDMPSGVQADTGAVLGIAVQAAHTLTFFSRKRGLLTGAGRGASGRVWVDALDLDAAWLVAQLTAATWLDSTRQGAVLPRRPHAAHKGLFGSVLVIGGDHGMAGAPRLSAEAALRCGAGRLTAFTRPAHVAGWLAALPEAMCVGGDSSAPLAALLETATAVVVGPGLGLGDWSRQLLQAALDAARPTVVDADALTLLATAPRLLPNAVLTPHPGEAARLLGTSTQDIVADPFSAATAIAGRYGAVTVLKGAGSVVATPPGTTCVIGGGNPGMAVPGMGDVLTGVIAALLAQGMAAYEAACLGTALHAKAGDAAVARDGEHGVLARDLMPYLRAAVNA